MSSRVERRQMRQLNRIGISGFETIDETQRRQRDLLRRLERAPMRPRRYRGLADCGSEHCGRAKCPEACQFGMRRRRLKEILAAHRLFKNSAGPIYEVRIVRGCWARAIGKLRGVSIAAAKQLNRRALDSLYNPDLVAVGTFKVSFIAHQEDTCWVAEIHQIVAGAKKAELERVFSTGRERGLFLNFFRITKVKNLGHTTNDVLKRDLQGWQHPWRTELSPPRPTKSQRTEYYTWLLGLSLGARVIRYGCDRYFNKLEKKPREFRLPKKRPYPYWLEHHMFGWGRWENDDPQSEAHQARGDQRRLARVVDPPPDYYSDIKAED